MKRKREVRLAVVLLAVFLLSQGRALTGGGVPSPYRFSLHAPLVGGGSSGRTESPPGTGSGIIPDIQGVPFYRQDDNQWKCEQLGTCNCTLNPPPAGTLCICGNEGMCPDKPGVTTIGSDGCALTCLAMVYGYYGGSMNPSELNTCLTNFGAYDYNGNCGDCWVNFSSNPCTPEGVTSGVAASIDSELQRGYPAIALLAGRNHYVVLVGKPEEGKYTAYDPQIGVTLLNKEDLHPKVRYYFHGPLPPVQNIPQPIGPSGGVEIENRSPASLSWIDHFDSYDIQLDVAPWHNNACWPREWWGTTFNIVGSSMDLYDFEDPEHLAFLLDGEYWWRIRGYRGDNPSDWSDWQHFLLVNCSPPFTFTFSPRLREVRVAAKEVLSQSYFCPSKPPGISTLMPTETPRPTPIPTATTIPFTKPQLVSPADGSEFTSGDQIVLTWSCPGGRAWSKCLVEREGEVYDSGWTKEFSWVSPINNFGEVKWKAIAKKGDGELSQWSDEWTYRIQGGSGIPPRLIDPTKGAVIPCGSAVLFHWECRSYECQIKTWHPDYDTHYTGWTKWTWWRVEAIHVHPGINYWSGKGRDEQGNETSWTEAWTFTIQGCTPTPVPTPVPTATATRTNTPWPTVTPMPTNTLVPTATATETLIPSPTPVPTSTQTPGPTNTPEPTATSTEVPPTATLVPTNTPVPTGTPVPTATAPSSGPGPTLSQPPPGSVFQSGAHIVLKWNPGPWDQYYCFVEREGQYYNSGWTTNTSWVSPVNDYGGVVWKVKARQGGVETNWSDEWHFDIEGSTGTPPRLIDPTKGAVFQCGNDVFFQWECRSYECLIETWHPAFDAHHTGWTKWHQWLIPPSAVHGGVNYWHGKGRDEQGRETSWTEDWTFTIQGCTPTPPIP